MVILLSEVCDVRTDKKGGESTLVCFTPKEKCPKQDHNNVKVTVGEFSTGCIKLKIFDTVREQRGMHCSWMTDTVSKTEEK
jgi:hypothetical protein